MDELSIFSAALELETSLERRRYLDEACRDNTPLRVKIDALLQSSRHADSFLESSPVVGLAPAPLDRPITEGSGTRIGPYKLLQQIGEGGFGVVYMAEQQQPVRRKVALKIIKPGMDTKEVIARFESERQALALMDHPNIAKVLDAGATESGRPYFVMELVKGIPITQFCDTNHLPAQERLELFIQVCNALQHAHHKGVIHRDLKPTNVMVTLHDGRPVPKVIDFGVAKATSQTLTERTLFTAYGQMIGTPAYMSPEQAEMSGLDIDTRSDIYSLGVLLYELLTGTTPFDSLRLREAGFAEMQRIIREEEPPKPSTRVRTLQGPALTMLSQQHGIDERRFGKILCGELDWIVMKALEKDRDRRYESASSLARDIHHYLADEPVLACPPTAVYQLRKFARKHTRLLATATAFTVLLLLGVAGSLWQAMRASQAEAVAQGNERQSNENAAKAKAKEQEANEQRGEAQQQRDEAQQQRDEAQQQRDEVKALNDRLAAKEQQLLRTVYAAHMNLAKNAWEAGGIVRVDELLEEHRPKPGETDLRGFEWYYLYRLCHSDLLTLKGHTRSMPTPHSVAFSPDGKRLAGTCVGDTVKVWDVQTGQELLSLKGGRGYGVAFSPDGKRLAFGNHTWDDVKRAYVDEELKIWDSQTGEELLSLQGHTGPIGSVAFSPDGKRLATGIVAYDKQVSEYVKVWDAQTGEELLSLKGHTSDVFSVAFSPDGKRLASASSDDDSVKAWDAQTGQELLSLKGGGSSVAFSADGKRLTSGGKVWDAEGSEVLSFKDGAQSVAFSPDGKRLARAAKEVKVLDAQTGDELITFKGHTDWVTSVVFSPDGTRLASGSFDGTIKVWDATTSQEPRTFSGHIRSVRSVSFSPDGKRLAFGTSGTWDDTKKASVDVEVKVFDARTGQELLAFKGHTGGVRSVVFSPNGKLLASGASDQTVKVWDAQTGLELLTLKGHTATVVSVVFSPDSTRLASSSSRPNGIGVSGYPGETGEVKVWDAQTGQELLNLKGHSRYVNNVAFSPDGKRLATLSRDKTVRVWDAQTGQEILTLNVLASHVGSVVFSPDGKLLASSNDPPSSHSSGSAKVWDAQSGEELLILKGHAPVTSVVFSPDSKRLVMGAGGQGPSSLGEVKVWDALTGQELLTLDGRSGPSNDVAFSPDGHRLAGIGRDGAVKIWDATPLPENSQPREKAP